MSGMAERITYYAIIAPRFTRENPSGLARRREDAEGGVHYEALGKEMTWHFSDVIPAWKRLEATEDLEEISEAEANELIVRFRERWANL